MRLLFAVLFLPLVLLAACGGETEEAAAPVEEEAAAPEGTREAPFVGHGIIEEVEANQLVINHENIPGFMPAMTMSFPVSDEIPMESLEVGDEIMFRIELVGQGDYQIFNVEPVED